MPTQRGPVVREGGEGEVACALDQVLVYFPPLLRKGLSLIPPLIYRQIEEIRLRRERVVMVVVNGQDAMVGPGGLTMAQEEALCWSDRDTGHFLDSISRASVYALEPYIRQGFVTLPGGHRVGLVGEAVMSEGRIRTIKQISSFNVRLARDVLGCADSILPRLVRDGRVLSSLIISAPGCGKTTLLRDLTRQVANGVPKLGLLGLRVAVADERSEIAACWRGVPQLDVGLRTDVLDGCPKSEAVMILLRSMGPQVIVTDEIGGEDEALALEEAMHSGVVLLSTAHGATVDEVRRRPTLSRLVRRGAFERIVVLSRRLGPGTVDEVVSLRATPDLLDKPSDLRAAGT